MATLDLFIPALFGPLPPGNHQLPHIFSPALDRLLGRGVVSTPDESSPSRHLGHICGLELGTEQDLPTAALCRLSSGEVTTEAAWMWAEPVRLSAEQDRLYLTGWRELAISAVEADALISSLNDIYREEGWLWQAEEPARWSIRLPMAPRIVSRPVNEVLQQDLNAVMPSGVDAIAWHRVMTEVQMVLHSHPVNQRRQQRGLPPINSVWFSGSGVLPSAFAGTFSAVFADDCLGRGLAKLGNSAVHSLSELVNALEKAAADDALLGIDWRLQLPLQEADLELWRAEIERLDAELFVSVTTWLQQDRGNSLRIHGGGACLEIDHRKMRRWWRRGRSLARLVAEGTS